MKRRLLLDVVVRQSPSILKLFTSKDETLLIWRNTFLILDLGFDILNGIRGFDLKGDGLASQCLHENLHTTTEAENQMQSGFFLNVVVRECTTIFKLLASKDQTLLVWRNALFILNFGLDIFNSIGRLNFQGDGFAS